MNSGFYKDLDTNFSQACEMSEKVFTHQELISLLKFGNIPEKQISALKLDSVDNIDEAQILLDSLTGCDGKIREAVALKINQLVFQQDNAKDYFAKLSPEIFADATIDINANICRLVIDTVAVLKENKVFLKKYSEAILNFINEAFDKLDKFIYKDKKYTINKQLFKLYWCLEAIKLFSEQMDEEILLKVLNRAYEESEYTIREKIAQIIVPLKGKRFDNLKEKLSNDDNYYVRNVIKSS